MTRKHTRRRHWPLINPVEMAIAGACITSTDHLDKLRLIELSAIDAFTQNAATKDDWRAMADMLNIAETLARSGVGPEVLAACELATQALQAAHASQAATGKLHMTGDQVQALRELHEYTDLQRTSIDRSCYERAINATANIIRGRSKDVEVLL